MVSSKREEERPLHGVPLANIVTVLGGSSLVHHLLAWLVMFFFPVLPF
jgi:hypothetical protein